MEAPAPAPARASLRLRRLPLPRRPSSPPALALALALALVLVLLLAAVNLAAARASVRAIRLSSSLRLLRAAPRLGLNLKLTMTGRLHSTASTSGSTSISKGRAQAAEASPRASVVPATEDQLRRAGEVLRGGGLVAFPTETVYGLGASAWDEEAVLSIFKAKGRPRTDPLIVHVTDFSAALKVVSLQGPSGPELGRILQFLGDSFWPGPLTLVAKASHLVPDAVTASTGFVGVRCPSHPIARSLLQHAAVPVCAPSANRFGHVSPTTAEHVMHDLASEPVTILDGGGGSMSCSVGIESTVARVDADGKTVTVLRRGAISPEALAAQLLRAMPGFDGWSVQEISPAQARATAIRDESQPQVAPGQLLKHYAPDVDAYLVASSSSGSEQKQLSVEEGTVVIDFGGRMLWCKSHSNVVGYRDLSPESSPVEAAKCLFDTLRWAENVPGANRVLLVECPTAPEEAQGDAGMAAAVNDRLFRAASGRYHVVRTL
jgi:L-threonylcarbamoyladenylate synthase